MLKKFFFFSSIGSFLTGVIATGSFALYSHLQSDPSDDETALKKGMRSPRLQLAEKYFNENADLNAVIRRVTAISDSELAQLIDNETAH